MQLFSPMERAQRAAAADDGAVVARRVENEGRWRTAAYAVMVLAAVLYFARLGVRALWASEFRWAEIAREMLLTRDYFWPTINGHVYFDKPLGSYWLVIAATWLTGGMNEAAARLPSAVAGLLAVGLLILLGRRLYDFRTAVMAAFILATSYSFVFWSRHADADIETVAGELAALLLFWRNRDRPSGWWIVGLWVLMAITSLTKGLLGFVLPLLVIGVYSSIADGWSAVGKD
ncbi:MAG TPA: glycosyltransferase family 39 protein, partial [Candidatus Binataceae bacterium]|nr:glycosyltransferase family 39 protein [Candidatus Binataceae bacterium]